VEVKKGFSQGFKAGDPHFSRRKSVHPGHQSYTSVVAVGFVHEGSDLLRLFQDGFPYDLYRQPGLVVQILDQFLRVALHLFQYFFSIKLLASCYKPYFETFNSHGD
jgi:hypothetical protein